MNLIFTHNEAKSIIATTLHGIGAKPDQIVIQHPAQPSCMNYVEAVHRIMHEYPYITDPSIKVLAIKRFREYTGVGLAEAKQAVENPRTAIQIYITQGHKLTSATTCVEKVLL